MMRSATHPHEVAQGKLFIGLLSDLIVEATTAIERADSAAENARCARSQGAQRRARASAGDLRVELAELWRQVTAIRQRFAIETQLDVYAEPSAAEAIRIA